MPRINPVVEHLERINEMLQRQLDERRKPPADFPIRGCGDSSCIVMRPQGQHTNGGCRCDIHATRGALMWWKRKAEFLEETIREMRNRGTSDQ